MQTVGTKAAAPLNQLGGSVFEGVRLPPGLLLELGREAFRRTCSLPTKIPKDVWTWPNTVKSLHDFRDQLARMVPEVMEGLS